jgi:DNA-binding NarL/FixJ family response regulator
MRAVIADDERLARQELKSMLATYPGIEIVGECADAKSAIEKVLKENGFKTKVSIKKEDILNKKMQELKMTVRKIV